MAALTCLMGSSSSSSRLLQWMLQQQRQQQLLHHHQRQQQGMFSRRHLGVQDQLQQQRLPQLPIWQQPSVLQPWVCWAQPVCRAPSGQQRRRTHSQQEQQ
jgi:hypothetical protein